MGICLLLIYYYIDPANSELARLMPKCPLKSLTGYDCPSCGIQRAIHALLNGDFKAAFWVNPFLTLIFPYLIAVIYVAVSKDRFALSIRPYVQHYVAIYSYLAIYFLWWVLRNTEWWLRFAEVYQ